MERKSDLESTKIYITHIRKMPMAIHLALKLNMTIMPHSAAVAAPTLATERARVRIQKVPFSPSAILALQ